MVTDEALEYRGSLLNACAKVPEVNSWHDILLTVETLIKQSCKGFLFLLVLQANKYCLYSGTQNCMFPKKYKYIQIEIEIE